MHARHDDAAVTSALRLLPERERWQPAERLNGLFSMTLDNLPLLGPRPEVHGLWSAEAIRVAHAAGAAAAREALICDDLTAHRLTLLAPDRFSGHSEPGLRRRALALCRDIYATP